MMIGECKSPVSSIQCDPVISPDPLNRKMPAKHALLKKDARGRIEVTPVLMEPGAAFSADRIDWVCTRTPETSVSEFFGPGWYFPRYTVGRSSRSLQRPEAPPEAGTEDVIVGNRRKMIMRFKWRSWG
jgi:hypothetical protein